MKMIYYFIQNGYKEDKHYEMQRNIRTIKKIWILNKKEA